MKQYANPDPEDIAVNFPPELEELCDEIKPEEMPGIVETDIQADLYLEELCQQQLELERLQRLLNARTELLQADIEKIRRRMGWYRLQLENYMTGLNNANPKKKSHPLSAGVLSIREGSERVVIAEDFTANEEMATNYPDFIRIKVNFSVDKIAVKKAIHETGECPPWATLEHEPKKVTIKVRLQNGREETID